MSRTYRDGRRRGGHRDAQHREYWSRRCRQDRTASVYGAEGKHRTHRMERHEGKRIARTGEAGRA